MTTTQTRRVWHHVTAYRDGIAGHTIRCSSAVEAHAMRDALTEGRGSADFYRVTTGYPSSLTDCEGHDLPGYCTEACLILSDQMSPARSVTEDPTGCTYVPADWIEPTTRLVLTDGSVTRVAMDVPASPWDDLTASEGLRAAMEYLETHPAEVAVAACLPTARSIERHVLTTTRPRPVDPDEDLRQRRRLAREDAQRRFDTIGLPRARSLAEAARMWPGVSL